MVVIHSRLIIGAPVIGKLLREPLPPAVRRTDIEAGSTVCTRSHLQKDLHRAPDRGESIMNITERFVHFVTCLT